MLARAAGSVVAIDPHAGSDRGPQEIAADAARGDADYEAFHANLARGGRGGPGAPRAQVLRGGASDVAGPLSLLYVDGAHRFGPARDDLAHWGARVAPGGTMLVHDAFSSIGVTLALFTVCSGSRDVALRRAHRQPGRVRARSTRGAIVARAVAPSHLRELPWFARNVAIKVLVLAGRRAVGGAARARPGRPMALLSARMNSASPATATQWTAMRSIAYSGL